MAIVHYLDASRLGLMTATARDRHRELVDFAAENAASAEMDQLLFDGGEDWPSSLRAKYPSLAGFPGIGQFGDKVKRQLGCESSQSVLFATTSDTHIRVAAALLFGPCKRILTTDLSWPVHRGVLEELARRSSREIVVLPIRDFIMREQPAERDLVLRIATEFASHKCDGLFLTAVSHDGLRFPASRIVDVIREGSELYFSVIDGAQEYAQVDHSKSVTSADLYLTSSHKWLGSFIPLSIAVYGRNRSATIIERVVSDRLTARTLDDPLMRLSWNPNSAVPVSADSTANVAALISCDGALDDFAEETRQFGARPGPIKASDTAFLFSDVSRRRWNGRELPRQYCSRTLLLESKSPGAARMGRQMRQVFAKAGLAVTAYASGAVRLSIPRNGWNEEKQLDVGSRIEHATSLL